MKLSFEGRSRSKWRQCVNKDSDMLRNCMCHYKHNNVDKLHGTFRGFSATAELPLCFATKYFSHVMQILYK